MPWTTNKSPLTASQQISRSAQGGCSGQRVGLEAVAASQGQLGVREEGRVGGADPGQPRLVVLGLNRDALRLKEVGEAVVLESVDVVHLGKEGIAENVL